MASVPHHAPQSQRGPKSLLTPALRRWLIVGLTLGGLMIANTLYLVINRLAYRLPEGVSQHFAEQEYSISKLFQVMVLSHTGLGSVMTAVLLLFAILHLPKVWKRHRRQTVVTGLIFVAAGLALALTGPFIVYASASRDHTWIWWTHVGAAVIAPVMYLMHRAASWVPLRIASVSRFFGFTTAALFVLLVGHAYSNRGLQLTEEAELAMERGTYTGPGSRNRDLVKFIADSHEPATLQSSGWMPPGFVPPGSPFFPSAATTTTGGYLPERIITRGDVSQPERLARDLDTIGFVVNEKIGAETCARCHADIVEQWSTSAHRFASFNNPFYEATINDMRSNAMSETEGVRKHVGYHPEWGGRTGMIKSKWCSGCHDPAVMLAGKMTEPVDRRSPQAQAGLTCLACHAIDKIHNQTGNGGFNVADEQEDPYLFAKASGDSWGAFLHDVAIKAKPEAHKRQMLKPFFRESEFCSSCHKVSLTEAVNDYRWFRGQNEYDNWHDSGVAHNASRTFYLPPAAKVCQDCHMPLEPAVRGDFAAKDGQVRSHRFVAVNTALPMMRGDTDTIARIEKFLQDQKLRIEVFALADESTRAKRVTYVLDRSRPTLVAGETVLFDVVVRNMGVGHTFPGGTNDSNEGWIEFTVMNDRDEVLRQSGSIGDDGYVDSSAHFFRALIVDRKGMAIRKRNAQDMYAPVYVNVIGPGTAHTIHYRVQAPAEGVGQLKVRARLLWRKFDRAYTEFAFKTNPDGFKQFKSCPDLPVTEIARHEVTLRVVPTGGQRTLDGVRDDDPSLADQWVRFNDYGIGLLLQADTKGAEQAFARVAQLQPSSVDGPRNLARVAVQDGNLRAAYQQLLKCEELAPNDPQTAWQWGLVLQEDGQYAEAAKAYQRVLQNFPEDRSAWRNLGRTLYLGGEFKNAIDAFRKALEIDPEDRIAHYHVMLCARALGDDWEATRAQAAYQKYKLDDSADEVTQAYRLKNTHDNRESQSIHVHDLSGGSSVAAVSSDPPAGMSPAD